jgi:hypothetical protein
MEKEIYYAPIVLNNDTFLYLIELIKDDLKDWESYYSFMDAVEDYDEVMRAQVEIKKIEERLGQFRYFYRHFKVEGKQ